MGCKKTIETRIPSKCTEIKFGDIVYHPELGEGKLNASWGEVINLVIDGKDNT